MTKVFIVHAHAEPKSFNGAMTRTAVEFLEGRGDEVVVSDLYAMGFDPVSDRRNFTSVKDPDYFKQQIEEMHATEVDGFAPDVAAEIEKLFWCDVMIFQFPLWWFGLPGILKGWVDRVFAMGKTYGGGRWYDNGVFAGKRAMLSLTTGGSESIYMPDGLNGDINTILFPINHGILYFVGFAPLEPFVVWAPVRISQEERVDYLERYKRRLAGLMEEAPIAYPRLEAYGEDFRLKKA